MSTTAHFSDDSRDELKLHIERDVPCTISLSPIANVFCKFGTIFPMVVPQLPNNTPDSFQWTWNGPSVKRGMPEFGHMRRREDLIGLIDRFLPLLPDDRPVMLFYTFISTDGQRSRLVLRIARSQPLRTTSWSNWLWSFVVTVDPVAEYTVPGSRNFDFCLSVQ